MARSKAGKIAAVMSADGAKARSVLAATVTGWHAAGTKVVGLFAEDHGLPDRTCGAGFLRDIVSGAPYSIYRETPPSHTSCHLDEAGVEAAGAAMLDRIGASDLVVLSKFGKLEAARSGLIRAFEAAIEAGKPVLTTVSDKHREAWREFAPEAILLEADESTLERWWRSLNLS